MKYLLILILFVVSCNFESFESTPNKDPMPGYFKKSTIDGHDYLLSIRHGYMMHLASCPCKNGEAVMIPNAPTK